MRRWIGLGLLSLLFACGTDEPFARGEKVEKPGGQAGGGGGGQGEGGTGGDEGGISFASDVDPILDVRCASCHAGNVGGLTLVGDPSLDYAAVIDRVVPGDPDASLLLTKARGAGHGGGAILSPGQKDHDVIEAWITEGALDN